MSAASQTLTEVSTALEAGTLTAVQAAQEVLAAVQAGDGTINSYVRLDEAAVLAQAEAADARRAAGETGPMLGVPIGIKDVLNVKGEPCTCGSKILEGYTSPYDATTVRRLREAGAVLVGRLNMDEFAMGSSNEHSAYGPVRNPWNPERVPGGSSGGSAAAVSAGLAVAALGSDTGGSIRQPASFVGCVGLKPSYGRVSRYGLTAYASSLDQVGPLTKTVADTAALLQVLAGPDEMDSSCVDLPVPDYTAALTGDISGMKLGLPSEYFGEGLAGDVRAAVDAAVEQCKALGADVVEVHLPHTRYAIAAYYIIATAEASANLARFDGIRYGARVEGNDPFETYCKTRAAGFGTEVKRRIVLGTYVLSSGYHDAYYTKAQQVRTLIRNDFDAAFEQCDALLSPVAPTAAYALGAMDEDPLQMYLGDALTVPANLAGLCALSVPCGFSGDAMPVGLQIIGPWLGEETILRVGHAYEQATDWHTRRPPVEHQTPRGEGAA